MFRIRPIHALPLLALVFACDQDVGPESPLAPESRQPQAGVTDIVSVEITPAAATLGAPGEVVILVAEVGHEHAGTMENRNVRWSSLDELVATVDRDGLVTAAGAGVARIMAEAGAVADTALVTVAPLEPPDQILFVSERDGNAEVYVMDADGSNPVNLTNDIAGDDQPVWSPDGSKIAFVKNTDIYVMNADGSAPVNLTNAAGIDDEPAWSPDGTKVAFRSNRDGNFEIYVVNVDGTGQTRLTNDPAEDRTPRWRPLQTP